MVILVKRTLLDFAEKHASVASPLNAWYDIAKAADWNKLADVKRKFSHVDYIGNDRYVFNIKGNDYRLVAMIFLTSVPYISRFIGTHAEYDKIDCTTI